MRKKKYNIDIFASVDWDVIGAAGKTLSQGDSACLTKHVGRYNPVGRQLKRHKYWLDSKCPRCGCPNEDSTHIVMCTHTTSVKTLVDSAYNFKLDLKKMETHPFIVNALVMTIHDHGQSTFYKNVPLMTDDISAPLYDFICKAAKNQDKIGFYPLFEGHMSKNWRIAQEYAYQTQA